MSVDACACRTCRSLDGVAQQLAWVGRNVDGSKRVNQTQSSLTYKRATYNWVSKENKSINSKWPEI